MYLYYYLTYNKPKNLFVYVVSYHEKNVFKKAFAMLLTLPVLYLSAVSEMVDAKESNTSNNSKITEILFTKKEELV